MKKLITILIFFACSRDVSAQTVVPATTTVKQLFTMPFGSYSFQQSADTLVDFAMDTLSKIACPQVDSVAIQALKVCPVCPPAKQRTVSGFPAWDAIKKQWIFPYDDGTFSSL